MARVVSFETLPMGDLAAGVARGSITGGTTEWMEADLIRLAPGGTLEETVPSGSDCYLFIIHGGAVIAVGDVSQPMPVQAAAVIQQESSYKISNTNDGETEILKVLAPPGGVKSELHGFEQGVAVRSREGLTTIDVPEQKKKRQYIVGHGAAESERGHVMIVSYEKDTYTALHHHPNAESMFVLLNGNISFTIDGKETIVTPGQATVFRAGDSHGLRCGEGVTEASFLEFHIPGAFTTVKD